MGMTQRPGVIVEAAPLCVDQTLPSPDVQALINVATARSVAARAERLLQTQIHADVELKRKLEASVYDTVILAALIVWVVACWLMAGIIYFR